jgi:hypothetical protein
MLAAILAVYGYLFNDVWDKVLMGISYVSICDGSSSQQQFHFTWMEDGQRREFGTRIC